jgi:hypothetical protein
MSRKKAPPRPEREDLFLEIQPTVCESASRFEREVLVLACFAIPVGFICQW